MAATIRTLRSKAKVKKEKKIKNESTAIPKTAKKPSSSALLMLSSELLSTGRFNEGLPSFVTRGLDAEQIWQQVDLRNEHKMAFSACTRDAVKVQAGKPKSNKKEKKKKNESKASEDTQSQDSIHSESSEEEEDMLSSIKKRLENDSEDEDADFETFGDSEGEDDVDFDFELENEIASRGLSDNSDDEGKTTDSKRSKMIGRKVPKRTTVVDDKFFKLADMEQFLESEDAKEEKRRKQEDQNEDDASDEDSDDEEDDEEDLIDMFEEDDEEDEPSTTAKYADFFDPPEVSEKPDKPSSKRKVGKDVGTDVEKKGEDDSEDQDDQGSNDGGDDDDDDDDDGEADDIADADESKDLESEEMMDDEDADAVETAEGGKKVSFAADLLASSDDDSPEATKSKKDQKSSFELKQEKLQRKAREMEDLSLKDPSWELTGEATASKRPENSLLETVLDFQHTTRAAPVITDDTTKTLEDYIKQRIKDKTFDDVERKEKPKEDVLEFKKRIVLDQEKSKLSLGELYEQEFLKQQKDDEDEVKADPECESIEKDLNSLFKQLDALSNFRYTPMKPGTEVKILVNTPAIAMEEVAPVATADSELLAPEEIHEKKRGDLKAADERDSTDKKRERRQKKKDKRERKKAKEAREKVVEKMKPGLGNKYSKAKALKQLEQIAKADKSVTMVQGERQKMSSSTSFFTQLQEEVQTKAKAKKASRESKKKVSDASKLML